MDFKELIAKAIGRDEITAADVAVVTERNLGDYCVPCFKLSKVFRTAPDKIAASLASEINHPLLTATAVGGYLNFRIDRVKLAECVLPEILKRGDDFSGAKVNKTVCIDYSSINIAKPFHIGHLLTTAIGGSLYRIYKYLGYDVVGINHLGDWGTQFGKLISAYLKWGDDADIEKRGIRALLDLYVRFHAEAEKDPALEDEARKWFKAIEDGDEFALGIFNRFKETTLKEVNRVYDRLGITFDSYNGESFYNDKMEPVVKALEQKKLLDVSDGARVVNLDEYGMPPCLILKSDGASLYATRDLAAAFYRKKTYDFYKCLYVVAYQQNLHFKQVFKVLELMGEEWYKDMVHVPFGMVSLEGVGALSTRKGNVVFLSEVLDNAVDKAYEIIQEKSPALEGKREIAECVGVGAVLFMALSTSRIKDMAFSYDKALSFDGETGPYLMYTHARCRSVIAKAGKYVPPASYAALDDEDSAETVLLLNRFDDTVREAAEKYEPSLISRYLIDLAQAYNKFYMNHRIADAEKEVKGARLALTEATAKTLKKGMELILLKAPERM